MENNEKIDQILNVLKNIVDGDDIAAFCLIAGPGSNNVAFITGDEDKLVSSLAKVMGEKEILRLMTQASAIALAEKLKILERKILKEKMTKKYES